MKINTTYLAVILFGILSGFVLGVFLHAGGVFANCGTVNIHQFSEGSYPNGTSWTTLNGALYRVSLSILNSGDYPNGTEYGEFHQSDSWSCTVNIGGTQHG